MAKVLGIIPARLASTRLPRKMLAPINGRPLIYWTWKRAGRAKLLDDLYVATESRELFDVVQGFGGKAVMASGSHTSGTERVAEAALQFSRVRYVVNIQGDEPLLSPSAIDAVVRTLSDDKQVLVATVASLFANARELRDSGNGKVVLNKEGNALYFSRSVIPFKRGSFRRYLKHIGVYGFQRSFLNDYLKMKPTPLERTEKLEQLRILENGYAIRVAVGRYRSVGVDTPADLKLVRKLMKE